MRFYFRTIGGELHLFRRKGLFGEDLGWLRPTLTGRLKTQKLWGTRYELRDISGLFAKGERYAIRSSTGLSGILERTGLGDDYELR